MSRIVPVLPIRLGFVVTLLAVLFCGAPARAAIDKLAGDLVVGALIDSAADRAEDFVETAGDRADETLLRAAYAAELVIAQLKVAYAESLDSTLDALDKAQRESLERALRLVSELDEAVGGSLEKIQTIEQNLSATTRLLPFAKTDPIVLRWEPQVLVAGNGRVPPTLTIEGRNLAAGQPFAIFRGRRLLPTREHIDDKLSFQIPMEALQDETFRPLEFQVRVFKRTTTLFFFPSLEARDYRVSVLPVPRVLGRFTIYGKKDVVTSITESRKTPQFKCHARHCKKDSESERVTIAEKDVILDMGSVKWHTTYDRNGDARIKDVSPGGFTVKLRCESYGCGPGGSWKGTRGQIKGYATYQVVRTSRQVEEEILVTDEELRWGAAYRLHTPEGIRTVSVVLTTIFDDEEVLGPGGRGRYFEVDFDLVARELVIRPRSLQQALTPTRSGAS